MLELDVDCVAAIGAMRFSVRSFGCALFCLERGRSWNTFLSQDKFYQFARRKMNVNETVVYKSKAPKKRANFLIAISIILLIGSIGCFALRGAKHEKTTMRSGYRDSDGNMVWFDERTGYINGQAYLLTEDGRQIFLVGGVVSLLMGSFCLSAGIGMKRNYLEIYSDHVSGVKYTLSLVKQHFSIPYEKIESVSFQNGVVSIKAGTLVCVMCDNDEEAYNQLWPYCPHK